MARVNPKDFEKKPQKPEPEAVPEERSELTMESIERAITQAFDSPNATLINAAVSFLELASKSKEQKPSIELLTSRVRTDLTLVPSLEEMDEWCRRKIVLDRDPLSAVASVWRTVMAAMQLRVERTALDTLSRPMTDDELAEEMQGMIASRKAARDLLDKDDAGISQA